MNDHVIRYNHKVLKDKRLVLEVLQGDFSISSLKLSRNMLYSDRLYNPHFDLLHDMREARMNFTLEEHTTYLHYLGKEAKVFTQRKAAILTSEPTLAKYSEWFGTFNGQYDVEFRVFSSLSKCLEWINPEIIELEIANELEKLRIASCSQCFKEPNAFTGF
jgi:hypothetical protein